MYILPWTGMLNIAISYRVFKKHPRWGWTLSLAIAINQPGSCLIGGFMGETDWTSMRDVPSHAWWPRGWRVAVAKTQNQICVSCWLNPNSDHCELYKHIQFLRNIPLCHHCISIVSPYITTIVQYIIYSTYSWFYHHMIGVSHPVFIPVVSSQIFSDCMLLLSQVISIDIPTNIPMIYCYIRFYQGISINSRFMSMKRPILTLIIFLIFLI